jgi:HK97 family phage portal protein
MAQPSFWDAVRGFFSKKSDTLELFREVFGGRPSSSGVTITTQRALEISTAYGCGRVISEGVAQGSPKLYLENAGRRTVQYDNPAHQVLCVKPNDWQTSFGYIETVMFHLVFTNNHFSFKNRVGSERRLVELVPIEPGRVTVKRANDYTLSYDVRGDDGSVQNFPAETIWHLRGPSWNSWTGMEAVKLARDALGLAIALEENQATFHRNGAKTSGLLSMENNLGIEKYAQLAAWLDKYLPGGERHQKPMILDNGASFTNMTMTAVDAQQIETRNHQVEEICRFFRVMPIMIGYSDKTATYASAEQMFLAHIVHTLTPWYLRLEQSANLNLLTPQERAQGMYFKFNANALLRGSTEARAKYFQAAMGSGGIKGWMTQNEVRALEELDRIDDPEADKLPQPAAVSPASKSDPNNPAPDPAKDA